MAMEVWFEVASGEVQQQAQALIAEHYAHAYGEQHVTAVFRHAAYSDKGVCQDWQAGGVRTLGKWVKVSEQWKCLMVEPAPDIVILLNYEAWEELTSAQRTALLDHELYHGVQRAHDIGEFGEILERRGDYLSHIALHLPADADLPLSDPETGEPLAHDEVAAERARAAERLAADPAFRRAARDLCPQDGDGIESVTLSSPGHEPVVLTGETRKKLDPIFDRPDLVADAKRKLGRGVA